MRRAWPALLLVACGGTDAPTTAIYDPTALGSADPTRFYDLPFPTDLRRTAAGTLDLTGYPATTPLVADYATAAAALDGWGLTAPVFVRFTGPLEERSLPDVADSLADDAAAYLVDVDADSPGFGTRVPAEFDFRDDAVDSQGDHALAARPAAGFPLAEGTTYALVVTDRVRAADGGSLGVADAFADVRAGNDAVHAPLWAWLDAPGGDDRDDVVVATVFTTQRATDVVGRLRQAVWAAPDAVAADVEIASGNLFTVITGTYQAPAFQTGDVPYSDEGGALVVDDAGVPVAQRTETLRFCLAVPPGDTPAGGWPLVLYQHGTGGDYQSFLQDGTAGRLAAVGLASLSMDQVLHGPRNPGGDPELDFFNFLNPLAARDNVLAGAADGFSLVRLALGLSIVDGARTHTIDPQRLYFFGHSQGATTGVPFVAYEPRIAGAVFSGAAGDLTRTLLAKTEPLDIPGLVATLARDQPLGLFTPTLGLLQAWMERADPLNYAALLARTPPVDPATGAPMPAKAIFQTEGVVDHYSPNPSSRALSVAIGGDLISPFIEEPPGLALRGRSPQPAPLAGNLAGTTVAVAQYVGGEGHFVAFDVAAARTQTIQFLATLDATGVATVVAP